MLYSFHLIYNNIVYSKVICKLKIKQKQRVEYAKYIPLYSHISFTLSGLESNLWLLEDVYSEEVSII